MAHRNSGKRKRGEKRAKREARERQRDEDVVQHSAAVLTCATEAADEMGGLLEELDLELPYLSGRWRSGATSRKLARPLRAVLT